MNLYLSRVLRVATVTQVPKLLRIRFTIQRHQVIIKLPAQVIYLAAVAIDVLISLVDQIAILSLFEYLLGLILECIWVLLRDS
jgi:hypothetical protein